MHPLLSGQAILECGTELCQGLNQLDTKSSIQCCRVLDLLKSTLNAIVRSQILVPE